MAEVQVAIPVPQEVHTPANKKNPEAQVAGSGPTVQVAVLAGQAKQSPWYN